MSELVAVPRIVIGNWQLCPDATLISPVEFSPQSASSTSFGQSGAARAGDTDVGPVAPTISAKATAKDDRMVDFPRFHAEPAVTGAIGRRLSVGFLAVGLLRL